MRKSKVNFLVDLSLIIGFLIGATGVYANVIGPQPVVPTNIAKGTLFVTPNGSGTTCSATAPCSIWIAANKAVSGDVVFLRGGTYLLTSTTGSVTLNNTGTAAAPVIYESYPGELAIFDGYLLAKSTDVKISMTGKFIKLRNIEVKNMPKQGVNITGTDNVIDGVHAHHNGLSGIYIYSAETPSTDETKGSRNTIRNCTVHDNSDAGLANLPGATGPYANGGNADGIGINSGADNRIENNLVYHNSDDGIDTWRSIRTYVGYNIVHSNGIAAGNGMGIKAGGIPPSMDTLVKHNLSYSNQKYGFDFNSGVNITFSHNTSRDNIVGGYKVAITSNATSDAYLEANISSDATKKSGTGIELDNSWQRSGNVTDIIFISTNPSSTNFLVPTSNSGFADIGAFADIPPDVIITSFSYANGIFTSTVKNQGTTATPVGIAVAVGYSVDGIYKTWGGVNGPLAAGASVTIGTNGAPYIIPVGTHTISAHVDDVNRFVEANENNNVFSKSITVP